MKHDDPRHGSTKGFHAGCRELCCRRALARDEKKRRLERLRGGRAIPALGAQRRIQALMRLGWNSTEIAAAAGWGDRNYVLRILNGQKGKPTRWLERKTHEAICGVYERLSMKMPEHGPISARTRTRAERNGWPPPLAWDDIDNPNEQPMTATAHRARHDVDEAVVLRVLAGDRLPMTTGERREVVRRAIARGWTEREIEERTGITQATSKSRYGTEDAA